MKEKIEIVTRFTSPIMTAEQYIKFSQSILVHLRKFHPIFESINSWGNKPSSWTEISRDFSNFDSVVFQHIYDEEINYKNPDNQKAFSLNSISWAGFSNSYSNTKKAQDGKFSISIGAGDENNTGFINIILPQVGYDEFYQTDNIKSLILHLLKIVQLKSAYVFTDSLFDHVVDFSRHYDTQIGWLNFFEDQSVAAHLKDVFLEQASEGCFFWLSDTIGTPSLEILEKAIHIRDILGDLDYLN